MISKRPKILIIDDEQVVCDVLSDELHEQGYLCTVACDVNEALAKLQIQDFEAVLLDIRLPSMSGMEVLRKIQSSHPNTATIMITAVNNVDTAVEAMKLGALDYIVKPFDLDRVSASIRTVLEDKKRSPEGRDKHAAKKSFERMNAIAHGVEAKLDLLDGHSKLAIEITIDVARQLGIPEEEIQGWVTIISRRDANRNAAIKSSLNKLERSPLAQKIMGLAVPYLYPPDPGESQN